VIPGHNAAVIQEPPPPFATSLHWSSLSQSCRTGNGGELAGKGGGQTLVTRACPLTANFDQLTAHVRRMLQAESRAWPTSQDMSTRRRVESSCSGIFRTWTIGCLGPVTLMQASALDFPSPVKGWSQERINVTDLLQNWSTARIGRCGHRYASERCMQMEE